MEDKGGISSKEELIVHCSRNGTLLSPSFLLSFDVKKIRLYSYKIWNHANVESLMEKLNHIYFPDGTKELIY